MIIRSDEGIKISHKTRKPTNHSSTHQPTSTQLKTFTRSTARSNSHRLENLHKNKTMLENLRLWCDWEAREGELRRYRRVFLKSKSVRQTLKGSEHSRHLHHTNKQHSHSLYLLYRIGLNQPWNGIIFLLFISPRYLFSATASDREYGCAHYRRPNTSNTALGKKKLLPLMKRKVNDYLIWRDTTIA